MTLTKLQLPSKLHNVSQFTPSVSKNFTPVTWRDTLDAWQCHIDSQMSCYVD